MSYPNLDTKQRGDRVVNVHPCGHRQVGIVEGGWTITHRLDGSSSDYVSVRTGPGSTSSGPAENWQVVE